MFGLRKSIANSTPLSSRPGILRSRGRVAPVASTIASCFFLSSSAGDVFTDVAIDDELDAFGS